MTEKLNKVRELSKICKYNYKFLKINDFFILFNYIFRCRCIVAYPPNSEYELELRVGDILYVHKIRQDGWYRGTLLRTGKSGLFPSSFVEKI